MRCILFLKLVDYYIFVCKLNTSFQYQNFSIQPRHFSNLSTAKTHCDIDTNELELEINKR